MMNVRSTANFLGLGYAVPWLTLWGLGAGGLVTPANSGYVGLPVLVGLTMCSGLAAWISGRTARPRVSPSVFPGRPLRFAWIAIAVPAIILLVNLTETRLGYTQPDWEMRRILNSLDAAELGLSELPSPNFVLGLGVMVDIFVRTPIYALALVPAEYAWRGFLLSTLLPMGRLRAYMAIGVMWAIWFAPVVFLGPVGLQDAWSTFARLLAMAVIFSVIAGELVRRTGALLPSAIFLGAIASQWTGTIDAFFRVHTFRAGGEIGFTAIGVWAFVALAIYRWPRPGHPTPPQHA